MTFQLRPSVTFVDREIFTSKIIRVKNFRGIFSRFVPSRELFLMVDGRAPGAFLAFSLLPGIAGCNPVAVRSGRRSGIHLVDVRAETYLLIIPA